MYGPIEGRRHDAFMLGESGLLDKLRRFEKPNGDPYIIYGDPAYGLTLIIIKFRYNARSDWLKQRALSEYRCTE